MNTDRGSWYRVHFGYASARPVHHRDQLVDVEHLIPLPVILDERHPPAERRDALDHRGDVALPQLPVRRRRRRLLRAQRAQEDQALALVVVEQPATGQLRAGLLGEALLPINHGDIAEIGLVADHTAPAANPYQPALIGSWRERGRVERRFWIEQRPLRGDARPGTGRDCREHALHAIAQALDPRLIVGRRGRPPTGRLFDGGSGGDSHHRFRTRCASGQGDAQRRHSDQEPAHLCPLLFG